MSQADRAAAASSSPAQSSGDQRAETMSQLKVGLPRERLTVLCVRHIHCWKARPLETTGGSRLQCRERKVSMHV
jgi:hypothetical protein